MNNAAPENTAALQEKIAELEQQLKLSDEGVSHLAERCLALEQKVQSYLAAHPSARCILTRPLCCNRCSIMTQASAFRKRTP